LPIHPIQIVYKRKLLNGPTNTINNVNKRAIDELVEHNCNFCCFTDNVRETFVDVLGDVSEGAEVIEEGKEADVCGGYETCGSVYVVEADGVGKEGDGKDEDDKVEGEVGYYVTEVELEALF